MCRVTMLSTGLVLAVLHVAGTSASASQVFFLDFDSLAGAPVHAYTPEERDQITSEMNALFAPLGMSVTQDPPGPGVFASTVFFNSAAAGTSDGIDFRNTKKTDNARLNARGMLEFVGIEPQDQTSEEIVRASINVGMHEALHLVGARHQDAFTLPGFGVPTGGIAGSYWPEYLGPRSAEFTSGTFMGLAAGMFGLSQERLLDDSLFISPRSALKAIVGNIPTATQQPGINSPFTAQPIEVHQFDLPNTLPAATLPPELADFLPPGFDIDQVTADQLPLFAQAAIVTGTITQAEIDDVDTSPSHYYAVPVISGMPYTIEVFSEVLDHRTDFTPFDTALSVIVRNPETGFPTLHPYYGTLGSDGFNRDGPEGIDPAMVDVIAPGGSFAFMMDDIPHMLVEVWSQSGFGQTPQAGDYELILYTIGVVEPDVLPGDYNANDIVDAADYTVWRDRVGSIDPLANDPIGGPIGPDQYDQWKTNFGSTSGDGASLPPAAVPEPSTCLLLVVANCLLLRIRTVRWNRFQ